jgi:phosphate transport system permease protein
MTEPRLEAGGRRASPATARRLARRHAAERRFRRLGLAAIGTAVAMLIALLGSIAANGWRAFLQTEIRVDVEFDRSELEALEAASLEDAARAANQLDFSALVRNGLRREFPGVQSRGEIRELQALVSTGARTELRDLLLADRSRLGRTESIWLPADDEVDLFAKADLDPVASGTRLSGAQQEWVRQLQEEGRIRTVFNWRFLTQGDSREPELAGVWGAVVGSMLALVVTVAFALPLGVCAAVYLEEFAEDNRWTRLIEVNINNLAAVPSIVFGLLGLAVFLNFMQLPRSAPLVGGLTLALMTLPTIIIAGRAAIQAVPPSIREAARGLGASPLQVVTHHVLPLAIPGILTGTIIGLARALGETAPLLMIGMVAFIVDIPRGFTDAATALPVQVFLWADSPERAFVSKTSGAILVLLAAVMNAAAIWLRQKFEKRW